MRANKAITTKTASGRMEKAKFVFCHLFTKIIGIGSSAHFSVFIISIMNRALNYNENTHKHMPNKHEKKRQNQTNSLCFDEFHRINFFCCLMLLLCAVRMTSNWNVILDDDLVTKVWQRVTAHHNHIIAASITNNTDSIQRKEERENRSFSRRSREKHLAQTPKLFLFTRTSTFYFECVGWKSVCRSKAIHTHSSEINSDEIFLGWHFSYLSFFRTNCGMKMCVWVCVLCLRMFWCGMSFTIQYDVLRYFANSMEKFCWFGFQQSLIRNGYTFAYLLDWGASEASINGTAKSTATTWNALCLCDG